MCLLSPSVRRIVFYSCRRFSCNDSVVGGIDNKGSDNEERGNAEDDQKGIIAHEWYYDGYLRPHNCVGS